MLPLRATETECRRGRRRSPITRPDVARHGTVRGWPMHGDDWWGWRRIPQGGQAGGNATLRHPKGPGETSTAAVPRAYSPLSRVVDHRADGAPIAEYARPGETAEAVAMYAGDPAVHDGGQPTNNLAGAVRSGVRARWRAR